MNQPAEDRLGTIPVGKLLATMSVPMMISFFIQALYNIVDSIFVAQISENALTAVSLAFPMQQIVNAIAVGLGVGVNACVPRFLAQKDPDRANRTVGNAILLCAAFFLVFLGLGLTSVRGIYALQTDETEIVELGEAYLSVCWSLCLGVFFGQVFEKLLVGCGHPVSAMLCQAGGAVVNLVLDPLLIFGIGFFPALGITGAAVATVTGQIFAALLALLLNLLRNGSVRIRLRYLPPRLSCLKDIFTVGIPTMVTMGLSSVTTFCVNQILLGYSTTATAVYGIWIKVQNFCYMPVYGMNNATVPILSYNYARGYKVRVNRTIRLAVTVCLGYLLVLAAVLECIPVPLLKLFSASDNMLSIGTVALRMCAASLPFGGLALILGSAMQSLRHEKSCLVSNLLRQFVYLIGLFGLLSLLTGTLSLVWLAVPLSELLSFVTALLLFLRMKKRLRYPDDAEKQSPDGKSSPENINP